MKDVLPKCQSMRIGALGFAALVGANAGCNQFDDSDTPAEQPAGIPAQGKGSAPETAGAAATEAPKLYQLPLAYCGLFPCYYPPDVPNNAFYLQHASNYGDGCGQFSSDTAGYNGNQWACEHAGATICEWIGAKKTCEPPWNNPDPYPNPLSDENGLVLMAGTTEAATQYYPRIAQGLPTLSSGHTINNLTLKDWLEWFKFPKQLPGESLQDYRDRAGILIYYNRMELGLGRELGCSSFLDGYDNGHQPQIGYACFVTNYGQNFYEPVPSTKAAVSGNFVKNTVCISYRPSQPQGFETQFWSFDENGNRSDNVQLDPMGSRQTPTVCTACHGGRYVRAQSCSTDYECPGGVAGGSVCSAGQCTSVHMAYHARFLPLNPYTVQFPDDLAMTSPPGTACAQGSQMACQAVTGCTWNATTSVCLPTGQTRFGQMERLRKITEITMRTPLRPIQTEYINKLWGNVFKQNATIPAPSTTTWPYGPKDTAPSSGGGAAGDKWNGGAKQKDTWNNVFLPYCGTCHMAIEPAKHACSDVCNPTGTPFLIDTYKTVVDFNSGFGGLTGAMCKDLHMPHAMPTQKAMWEIKATISGVNAGAPLRAVDALLESLGQADCPFLQPPATCATHDGDHNGCFNDGCYYDHDTDKCKSSGCTVLTGGMVDLAASDNKCGPIKGLKCDTKGGDYNGNYSGRCVPGCRWNSMNANAPTRGCAQHYECLSDNLCHACGRPGEPVCTTSQSTVTNPCEAGAYQVGGNCVECTMDGHCAGKVVGGMPAGKCDTGLYKCVGCSMAAPCAMGLTCDTVAADSNVKSYQCVTACGGGHSCSGLTWCNPNNTCLEAPEVFRYQNFSDSWGWDNQDKWYKIKNEALSSNDPSPKRLEFSVDTWSAIPAWPNITLSVHKSDGSSVGDYSDSSQYSTIAGHNMSTYHNWSAATKTNQTGGTYYNIQSSGFLKDPNYVGDGYYYIKAHNTSQGYYPWAGISNPGAFTMTTATQNNSPKGICDYMTGNCFDANYTDAHMPYYSGALGDSNHPGHPYGNLANGINYDTDWYRLKADASGRVVVQVNSVLANGDLDFKLYDGFTWSVVATNTATVPDVQTIPNNLQQQPFFQGVAGRYYYLKIYGYNGAKNRYVVTFGNPDNQTMGAPDPIDNTF